MQKKQKITNPQKHSILKACLLHFFRYIYVVKVKGDLYIKGERRHILSGYMKHGTEHSHPLNNCCQRREGMYGIFELGLYFTHNDLEIHVVTQFLRYMYILACIDYCIHK